MTHDGAADTLITSIYDAALDAALWPKVMRGINDYVRGCGASLVAEDRTSFAAQLHQDYGSDPTWTKLYVEKYVALNPLPRLGMAFPINEVFTMYDLVPEAEFKTSPFFLEWVQPQGFVDTAVVNLDKTATSFAALVVRRSEQEGLFDDAARQRLARLAPHVRRAVLVGKTIEFHASRVSLLSETLSKLTAAAFLLATDGRVMFANDAAKRLLRGGQLLSDGNNRLAAINAKADSALRNSIEAAARGDEALGTRGLAIELSDDPDERWLAHVLPLTEGTRLDAARPHAAAVAVFVRKASLDLQWPLAAIGKLFGLTPMELKILQAVIDVGGAPAIAQKHGISEGTVRTHLKSIFAKTGAKRQVDLIKLIASHAPGFCV